jgi:hypothetical protein
MLMAVTTPLLAMLLCGLTLPLGGKEASQTHSFSSETGGRRLFSVFCEGRGTEGDEVTAPKSFCSSIKLSEGERTYELGLKPETRIERSSRKGPFIERLFTRHLPSDLL